MINQTQIITIFVIYASLSLVLYLLKTIMGETKYNQYIKNNIYYIPLVQMFDNILNYDELILFKVILTSIIYMNINLEKQQPDNDPEKNLEDNLISDKEDNLISDKEDNLISDKEDNPILDKEDNPIKVPSHKQAVKNAVELAKFHINKDTNVLSPPPSESTPF